MMRPLLVNARFFEFSHESYALRNQQKDYSKAVCFRNDPSFEAPFCRILKPFLPYFCIIIKGFDGEYGISRRDLFQNSHHHRALLSRRGAIILTRLP